MADSCGPSAPKPAPGASTNTSGRKVMCVKFQKELPGLDAPPMPGPLGQRIFENVSRDAWKLWAEHSKMLINEYRLDLVSEAGQRIWMTELEKFFFGEGSSLPAEFVPTEKK